MKKTVRQRRLTIVIFIPLINNSIIRILTCSEKGISHEIFARLARERNMRFASIHWTRIRNYALEAA